MSHKKCVRAIVVNGDKVLAMQRNKFGLQYYTLVGGGVKLGEDAETALRRELREETGLDVGQVRLVFIEDAGEMYGEQYVYLCEYKGGEPVLSAGTEEAAISAMGQNTYQPVWLSVEQIAQVNFRSSSVRQALVDSLHSVFPDSAQTLAYKD